MGFISRLESRDHGSRETSGRPGSTMPRAAAAAAVAAEIAAVGLNAKKGSEADDVAYLNMASVVNENVAVNGATRLQDARDGRTEPIQTHLAMSPNSGGGPTAVKLVSKKSMGLEPVKHKKSMLATKKQGEELVEIKPRGRELEDINRDARLEKSAFDELPPPEVYDPSWNTLPLRCEAGKLGRSERRSPAEEFSGPVLPGAFKIHSSTDFENDEDNEDEFEPDNKDQNFPDEAPDSAKLSVWSTKSRYSISRMSFGNMTFLSRKKKDGSVALEIFRTADNIDATQSRLRSILPDVDSEPPRCGEIRSRTRFFDSDTSYTVNIYVIFAIEQAAGQTRVTARRSKTDRSRITPDMFCKFCVGIFSKYKARYPNAVITLSLPDGGD
jgi:hypothetical protein